MSPLITPIARPDREPAIITLPGLDGSEPRHWQTVWERQDPAITRIDMGDWSQPHRNLWVNRLNLALHRLDRPAVLVAHSLGCLALAWWVAYEQPRWGERLAGALLVAPPDVDCAVFDQRLLPFAPTPLVPLPFPSLLVASRNDPYAEFARSRRLASFWGSEFCDAGYIGHINGESGLGSWTQGRELLGRLIGRTRGEHGPVLPQVQTVEYALAN